MLCDNPVPYINCFGVPVLNCFGVIITQPPTQPGGGITTGCCENPIPQTLSATIMSTWTSCPGEDIGIELIWDGEFWTGSAPFGGSHEITLSLECAGSDISGFVLHASWTDNCSPPQQYNPQSGSCSPMELEFAGLGLDSVDCCDGGIGGEVFQVFITE